MMTMLVIFGVAIVVLAFIVIKQSYEINNLKEAAKDKDAKYHSLLGYIETMKAAKTTKKSR
jgi:heme/copper-type cytochrome/quinol oxidase subunit 2